MGRRDYPDAEKIAKRAGVLRDKAGSQNTLDTKTGDQYSQANIIAARKKDAKAIGFGMVGNMVDKRVNIMGARPFARVLALGGHPAEAHASGKLEPWLNTAVWLAQGDFDVWDTGVHDQQKVGRFWSIVLPASQFHGGPKYEELVAEWKRRIEANEDREEVREEIRVYRRDHFPIVWRYCEPSSVFVDWDEEGMAEYYWFRKMTRLDIESRWPGVAEGKDEDLEVIHYANDAWTATILPEGKGVANTGIARSLGKLLGEPWEHGMGISPFVRIKRAPLGTNSQGYEYTGCSFHVREMSDSLDESATDWRSGMHREAQSPVVITLNPQLRAHLNLPQTKIKPDDDGNIIKYTHKDYGTELVERGPVPTVNEQLGQYIGLVGAQADRGGASVPELIGQGASGESAVHASTVRQSAITGELEVPHRRLEEGFAAVCERMFRCVIALDKKLPEGADDDMRQIVVRAEDGKNTSKRIAVTAKDVRNYELMVRGKIQKNLPVNTGQNVINLRELTDPDRPLLDNNTGLEMFLNIDNPQEIADRLFQQRARTVAEEAWLEDQKKRVMLRISEFSEEQMAKLAVKMLEEPEAIQAAVMGKMGQEGGNRLMEQMSRGAANQGRAGREQRMSQLQEEPVV